jgi:FkbM family methyltransferase
MKKLINNIIKPFHVEIHGVGYIKKLRKASTAPDAFEVQGRLLKNKAGVIFDVGANRGEVSEQYARLFPSAVIHAFEPFEEFHAEYRRKNADPQRFHLSPLALSEKEGTAEFFLNKSGDTNSLLEPISIGANSDDLCSNVGSRVIRTGRLDQYAADKGLRYIDILKMDTQGSELSILKGSEGLLSGKKIGVIYTEGYFKPQYKDQPLLYDIANYLKGFGYYLEGIYDPYYNDRFLLWCDAIFLPLEGQR